MKQRGNPRITLRLEPETIARLHTAADALSLPVSEIVRVAILNELDELGIGPGDVAILDGQMRLEEVEV